MNINVLCMTVLLVAVTTGCATAQPDPAAAAPMRLDELVALSGQGLGDDAVIARIEQRGVAFVLSPQDLEGQRAAGVSDGVFRYLQGRASGEQDLKACILRGRYYGPQYHGPLYLGYPYLGYHDGSHYYGGHKSGSSSHHLGRHHGHHHSHHFGHGHHRGRH